ncbi:hypothetical protein [Xylophilus rhododendri]|uniref:hypothetical protein n=1 Tax=Xylophilus rhododendri TaxID=2697032 RepID=UPI001E6291A1|nr:hypothetical protein [Xylophilus rhododendri]
MDRVTAAVATAISASTTSNSSSVNPAWRRAPAKTDAVVRGVDEDSARIQMS